MQKGLGKKQIVNIYSVYPPTRRGEKFIQLRDALLINELNQELRETRAKSFNKCQSSDSYKSVEKVIEKMIPILERNASKVKINQLAQANNKNKPIDILYKVDQVIPEKLHTVQAKPSKIQEYKTFKKSKVNIMNLQLIPGQQPTDQTKQIEDNRVKQMIEKRRAESSVEKLRQKQRFRIACASLLHGKHLKMNSQQFQHNNRFVKHMLSTLKCSRIQTQQQQSTQKQDNCKDRELVSRASEEMKRPATQGFSNSSKHDRKYSVVNIRKSSTMNLKKMVFCMSDFSADKIYKKKIESYVDFLYKINFGNMIYVNLNLKLEADEETVKIKAYVGRGNNNKLIKSLLKRRFWIELVAEDTKGINFYWTQSKQRHIHALQQEYVKDDTAYKEKYDKYKQLKLAKNQQNSKILSSSESKIVQNYLKVNSPNRSIFPKNAPELVTNHIPQNSLIGNKKALFHSLNYYYKYITNQDPFQYIPLTFHIKSINDQPYQQFLQYIKDQPKDKVWIVKPGQNTNRGNGINLAYANQIVSIISKKKINNNGAPRTYIVQSYINNPFLYNNRKFDIRHYMMITSVNGILKGYWYQDGYIRTSSEIFDLEDINNKYIHLTNDAIQKYGQYYGKYQIGNKVSYTEFQRYLDYTYPAKKYNFEAMILPRMRKLAYDAIRANFLNMDSKKKLNNFQIYGMDFMIDSNFKPWLIEINANPCLEMSCPLLSRIIPPLIQNTLRLGLDPLFPPTHHYPPSKRFQLSDNILSNLRFQIIFDERNQREKMVKIIEQFSVKHQVIQDISDFQDQYQDQGEQIQQLEC